MQHAAPALAALRTSAGEVSPGFSPGRTEYVLHVPYRTAALTVDATAASPTATVRVQGRAAGDPAAVELPVGRSLLKIEVADGGAAATYTVRVMREASAPAWERVVEHAPFVPRDSAGELVFDNRMWLFGGYTPGLVSDVWATADGANWTRTGTIPGDAGVNIPINLAFHGRMWVTTNDGALYASRDGAAWEQVLQQAPWGKRYGAGGAVFRDRMWVMGGMRSGQALNDVWSSADGTHWVCEQQHAAWSPRQLFSMVVVHAGRLWVVGGGITVYHPFQAFTDVWSSEDGRSWKRATDHAPWPARTWSSAAVYRNRIWVFGGFRSEPTWNNFGDAWYSADGKAWHEFPAVDGWAARHELSGYVHRDRLWAVAGNTWPLMNDVWSLHIPGLCFLSQPGLECLAGIEYVYRARADFHTSGAPLRYRIVTGPPWMRITGSTGVLRGIPPRPGEHAVELEARDDRGETARQSFVLHAMPTP